MPVSVPLEMPLDLLGVGGVVGDEEDVDAAPGAGGGRWWVRISSFFLV